VTLSRSTVDADPAYPVSPDWRGVVVFVLRERAGGLRESAVAAIARGLEILEIVPLDAVQRAAARRLVRSGGTDRDGGGDAHTFIVACDVVHAGPAARTVEARAAEVCARATRRLLRDVDAPGACRPLHHSVGPQQALDHLDVLGDIGIRPRLLARIRELDAACAVPFPLVRMLAPGSPGYRSRVALVDHPVHGPAVCKIFRPGAAEQFRHELEARTALADLPQVPELLDHGPNWLLTPVYADNGSHLRRRLPGLPEMSQLRPEVSRSLAGFARALHERGLYMLDLSPHNLLTDPDAGLKVLDLEFVLPYAGVRPPLRECYTFRGIPRALQKPDDNLPDLVLTKGVGNSVFHPAVAGARVPALLRPARRGDALRTAAVQLAWFAAFRLLGALYFGLARRRGNR
jgi:hypothetical protein